MRTEIPDLPSPRPLGERLPGVFVEDEFTQRFTAALDDVLAPVFVTLDCFAAYLDPALAPGDFVDWLASWVALDADHGWADPRGRELVRRAVTLHRLRGTRKGLVEQVRLLTDGEVELTDTGGCTWSAEPGAPLPGSAPARVEVRVRVSDPAAVDVAQLSAAVSRAVPAHVGATIEVIT